MRLEELYRLRGVIAFPVTPFKPDLSLDIAGLRRTFFSLYNIPSPQSSRRAARARCTVKTMLEAPFGVAEDSGLRQERN